MLKNELIWIIDSETASVELYKQTLGLQYGVQAFSSLDAFKKALAELNDSQPSLILADPAKIEGSFADLFACDESTTNRLQTMPAFIIVSQIDDLDLMRFYLKIGARDYILKPVRPNELVAKVEKSLAHISNSEVRLLRNDLDGVPVGDLTFREHQMLTIFLSRLDRCVSREALFSAIWSKVTVNRKTLDVHLFNLRRKIRPLGYDIVCRNQIFHLERTPQSSGGDC